MQELKPKFANPDGTTYSSIQSCIRTNDLDSIGDGTHLSSFEMVGNFSFAATPYKKSCEMWLEIVSDLGIEPDFVTYHPDKEEHGRLWQSLGMITVQSEECIWSDGNIGGYCTEMFRGGIEIGNLVNTLDVSTDVGFGLERMAMLVENQVRVDSTSLFPNYSNPIVKDHVRTVELMFENSISPSNKHRGYICRKLIRKCLHLEGLSSFSGLKSFEWFTSEKTKKDAAMKSARSSRIRHRNKGYDFWLATFGLLPEEVDQLLSD